MRMPGIPFETTDWELLPAERHPGDSGFAEWRTRHCGEIRVRLVRYSPGYVADHWCEKGHVLFCVEGEMLTRLQDGREASLRAGMSYQVGDGPPAHRTSSARGATLFVVD